MRWTEEDLAMVRKRWAKSDGRDAGNETDDNGKAGRKKTTKKHKFNARPTTNEGVRHDSSAEGQRWEELKIGARAGEIKELERQVRVKLEDGNGEPYLIRSDGYPNGRKAAHVIDFRYRERNPKTRKWKTQMTYEDVKGHDTPVGRLKRAIAERILGTEIKLTRKSQHKRKPTWITH